MKNSKFDEEIQKRMQDPTWDSYIAKRVKHNYQLEVKSSNGNFFLDKAAAILLIIGLGWGILSYYSNNSQFQNSSSELTNNSDNSALTNVDIKDLDLLLEEDEFNSDYLITGMINISE